ncbi:MAG: type II secretion system F family protein [Candidatus Micrarchaeota archaeon]
MKEKAYDILGRFVPRNILKTIEYSLKMAGIDIAPESFAGITILLCVFVIAMAAGTSSTLNLPAYASMIVSVSATAAVLLFAYLLVVLRIETRKNQIETVLPDFLQIAASNVRAGMPVDQALWFAARPEFGLLSQEVELVAKRTYGGESLSETLNHLSDRFKSQILRRTVSLINHGISSGGAMAGILEDTADDIRRIQLLRKEISASMLMYVIFITFASIIGAPFLYSVSYKLISVLQRIWDQMSDSSPVPQLGFLVPTSPGITPGQFFWFSFAAIIITAVIASFIVSVIQTGSKKSGVKYIPLFGLAGISIFLIIIAILDIFTK